jgi:DNA-binding transcriptional LysR family regulator
MRRSMAQPSHISNYHLVDWQSTIDMNISHRQVEIFRAVMQGGSLVAAAMALHTSQPTLSRDLALLEQRLGYRLFDRRAGSRLRPTAAALQLYEVVTQHYRGLADVQAAARALARQDAGRLRVATLPALAHALLPAALATLTPCPALTITPLESPQLEREMAEQGHDLAVAEQRGPVSGCRVEALPTLAEVAVLPAGHALLAKTQLVPADFSAQDFISLADDDPYRAAIDAAFEQAGVTRALRLQTASSVAVCALVAQGLGIAIVNPLTALASAGPRLHWRPLSWRIPYELVLLRPLQRASARAADALAEALRAQVHEMSRLLGEPGPGMRER